MPKANFDVVLTAKPFDTNCTEVAPRSDVIGEVVEDHWRGFGHVWLLTRDANGDSLARLDEFQPVGENPVDVFKKLPQ